MTDETSLLAPVVRSRKAWLWTSFGLAAIAAFAFVAPLYMEDLDRQRFLAAPLGFWLACLGAPLVYAAILFLAGKQAQTTAADQVGTARQGLAGAVVWLCSPVLVLAAAALYQHGQDGLAVIAGILAGYLLMALVLLPGLATAGASDPIDYISQRFGVGAPRWLAFAIVLAASLLLLIGLARTAGLSAAALFALPLSMSLAAVMVLALAAALASQALGRLLPTAAGLGVVLVLVIFGAASVIHGGWPVPQLGLGAALEAIAAAEADLVDRELADPARLKPFLAVFSSLNPIETLALAATLMLGLAVMPHLAAPFAVAGDEARSRRSAGVGFFALALIVTMVPVLVVAIRLGLYSTLVGLPIVELPDWLFQFGQSGLVALCGQAAVSPDQAALACDGLEILPLEEFGLAPEAVLAAGPRLMGFSGGAAWAVGLLVLLISLAGMAVLFAQMLRNRSGSGVSLLSVAICFALAVAGFAGAQRIEADIIKLAGWGLSIVGAGLFPVILLGLIWRRCSALAAFAGMLTGSLLAGGYIVAVEMAWISRLPGFESHVAGVLAILPAFAVTVIAALVFPAASGAAGAGSAH